MRTRLMYAAGWASALLLLCASCGRFGFESGERPDGPPDAAGDAARGSDDASAAFDGRPVASRCPGPDPRTIALYTFDDDSGGLVLDSASGAHHGGLVNSTVPALITGPPGCGEALSFPSATGLYVDIADSSEWQLTGGSIDLWVRPPPPGRSMDRKGIVTRDATGNDAPGHFSLWQWAQGDPEIFVVRIQDGNDSWHLCSDSGVAHEQWTHIGINFGPPSAEMWINGVLSTNNNELIGAMGGPFTCNIGNDQGIDGNFNPWAFGTDTSVSGDGSTSPNDFPYADGAIDHVRISSVRRDFSGMAAP